MPTTASSEASVRWPLRSCTLREMGKTRCAKNQVSTAIGGIVAAASAAKRQLTRQRTIAAPMIIIPL